MFAKEKKALSDIAEVLSHEPSVLLIVAYGSRIRGDFMEDSVMNHTGANHKPYKLWININSFII